MRLSSQNSAEIWEGLRGVVQKAFDSTGSVGAMELFGASKPVADDTIKVLIHSRERRPIGVLIVSNSTAPFLVARGVENAAKVKAALPPALGRVILEPLATGEIDGCSYVVYPWRQPLVPLRWYWAIQRASLRPRVIAWLRGVAKATAVEPANIQETFLEPLSLLVEEKELSDTIRGNARRALERLNSGSWKPLHVLSHNDFWQGNILLDVTTPSTSFMPKRFLVIDWAGSTLDGYAIGDLVRASQPFRLDDARLAAEIDAHCRILQCSREDAKGYLLAGIGYLSTRLEHFPRDLFLQFSEEFFVKMCRALEM